MLKIDVEGWELEVFKGSKNLLSGENAPIVCVEYTEEHPTYNGSSIDIYNFILTINRYKIFRLQKSKEVSSKLVQIKSIRDLPKYDNLFCFLEKDLNILIPSIFLEKDKM